MQWLIAKMNKVCRCRCHVDDDTSTYERGHTGICCGSCSCDHQKSKYIDTDGALDLVRSLAVIFSIRKRDD